MHSVLSEPCHLVWREELLQGYHENLQEPAERQIELYHLHFSVHSVKVTKKVPQCAKKARKQRVECKVFFQALS